MKASRSLSALVFAVALAGCASNSLVQDAAPTPSPYDETYMAKVERVGRARGVVVQWVNPPEKKHAPEEARPH